MCVCVCVCVYGSDLDEPIDFSDGRNELRDETLESGVQINLVRLVSLYILE
jgi:hypothetical protein